MKQGKKGGRTAGRKDGRTEGRKEEHTCIRGRAWRGDGRRESAPSASVQNIQSVGIFQYKVFDSGDIPVQNIIGRDIPVQNIQSVEIFQCKIFSR